MYFCLCSSITETLIVFWSSITFWLVKFSMYVYKCLIMSLQCIWLILYVLWVYLKFTCIRWGIEWVWILNEEKSFGRKVSQGIRSYIWPRYLAGLTGHLKKKSWKVTALNPAGLWRGIRNQFFIVRFPQFFRALCRVYVFFDLVILASLE